MSENNEEQMMPTPSDFGHFILEKELGHGGMGGVYLARDKMLDRKVGIKVMLKSLGDDPEFVERFQREAQAAARLNHPNIAQIYSFGQESGMPYIAMELVSGGSLDKEMEAHPAQMDPVRVMKIGSQVADALALAAEQGLVHGDVKPENVLFDVDGNAKLVDFGLAAMQGDSDEIWGTPYYISPEKVRRQKIDYRADIYSLGGTLYHALTGIAPFEGADATEVVKARFNGPPKKPSEVRPGIPVEVDTIIMRMLELEPSMRYPTYQSLLGDFKRFLSKAGPRKTGKVAAPRVKIKGTQIKMKLNAAEKAPASDVADLDVVSDDASGGRKGLGVGAIVALAVVGVVLAIILVAGGLFWYVHSEEKRKVREEHQALVAKCEQGRNAIKTTLTTIAKFGEDFHVLVSKNDKEVADAVRQVKAILPENIREAAIPYVETPPTQDIADAIAYTNQLFIAAAAQADADKNAAAADAKAAADTNTVVKVDGTNTVAAVDGTNTVVAVDGTNVVSTVDGTNAVAEVAADAAEAKPAEETAAEAPVEEEKKEEVVLPTAVRQFSELWADIYACRAADIRVQGNVQLLLEKGKAIETLKGEDDVTVKAIAKLAQTLVEGYEQLQGMKCVDKARRKVPGIRSRSNSLVRNAQAQIKRMIDKAERAAKAKAEKEAKEAAAAKAAEERKIKVAEETKIAQAKFDDLVGDRLKSLDWEPALKQLQRVLDDMTTSEGRDEVRSQMMKVQDMRELQKVFIEKAKGFTFKDGSSISEIDAKAITIQPPAPRRGSKKAVGRPQKIEWRRFYGKKENVGYMNQMLNHFVFRGRDTLHTGPLPWSKQMLGAALTLQLLYSDVEGVDKVVPKYVKKAMQEFEECGKWAKKWFPEINLEIE